MPTNSAFTEPGAPQSSWRRARRPHRWRRAGRFPNGRPIPVFARSGRVVDEWLTRGYQQGLEAPAESSTLRPEDLPPSGIDALGDWTAKLRWEPDEIGMHLTPTCTLGFDAIMPKTLVAATVERTELVACDLGPVDDIKEQA